MSDCDVCVGGFGEDPCTFSRMETPTARKMHRCSECDRAINKGEKYQRVRMLFEGEFSDFVTCLICAEIRKVFSCGEGEQFGGMLWEDLREYAFPKLTTASPCFRELSPPAKEFVLSKWREWKL